jgi:HD-like signal output (HDOD) protein
VNRTTANAPRIGRFLLSHRLGRDSIATVYRATDPRHRRDVAIKLLHSQIDSDHALQQMREQMMDEVRHPALCSLYSIDQQQGLSFLAYEYVDGVELADILAADGVRVRDLMPMVGALVAGFAELHKKGIHHLGLTPNRIKLTAEGAPKILSLGRSLLVEAAGESNIVKRVELRYMAPEQFDHKVGDARTDVFRLCLVLFEVIARKSAIKAGAVLAIRDQIKNLAPAPDALGKSSSARALMTFLRKGLAPNPEQRYADAGEMLAALPKFVRKSATAEQRRTAEQAAASDSGSGSDAGSDSATQATQIATQGAPPPPPVTTVESVTQDSAKDIATIDVQAPAANESLSQQAETALAPNAQEQTEAHADRIRDAKVAPASLTKGAAKPTRGNGEQTLAYVLERLANSNDFPALSQSVFEVNQLTSLQANTTVSQIADVILRDYALSNNLLTLANSAYYGVRVEVTRVTDAIRLLGFEQVRITANGLAYTAQIGPGMDQLRDAMLKSFTSGLVARQLAEDVQIKDAEEAFLCAMFYNTGEHLIIHYLPDEYAHTINTQQTTLANGKDEAAMQVFGITFATLGAAAARSWRFPEKIVSAIEGLNADGEPLDDTQLLQLSWIARGSNELCELVSHCTPDTADEALQSLVVRLAEHLRVDAKQLRNALHEAAEKAQAFAPVLGIDANNSAYMQALLQWGPPPLIENTTPDVTETRIAS